MTVCERNDLAASHIGLAKTYAHKILSRLPRCVDRDEATSNALLGLLSAVERYSPGMGSFRSYSYIIIRGAILDGLRRWRWAPQGVSVADDRELVQGSSVDDEVKSIAHIDAGPHRLEVQELCEWAMRALPPDDRLLLRQLYLEDLTPLEVGRSRNVGEARISQRRKSILAKCRASWDD